MTGWKTYSLFIYFWILSNSSTGNYPISVFIEKWHIIKIIAWFHIYEGSVKTINIDTWHTWLVPGEATYRLEWGEPQIASTFGEISSTSSSIWWKMAPLNNIRFILKGNVPWFLLTDVTEVKEYSNHTADSATKNSVLLFPIGRKSVETEHGCRHQWLPTDAW